MTGNKKRASQEFVALDQVSRSGFNYNKAEVMLLSSVRPGQYTDGLFATSPPVYPISMVALLDHINKWRTSRMLYSASAPSNPDWAWRQDMLGQSYTSKLDQLWTVSRN